MSRARRRLAPEQRRDEIVRAALRLFATRDAPSVSMTELAQASGASAALIYHYFGDKHRLAVESLSAAADELVDRLDANPAESVVDQLTSRLDIYLGYLADHPVSFSALLNASAATSPELAAIARRVDDHAVVLACRALGCEPPPTVLELSLYGWLEFLKSVARSWLPTQTPDRSTVHALLTAAFFGCVEAAAAADPSCAPAAAALRSSAAETVRG